MKYRELKLIKMVMIIESPEVIKKILKHLGLWEMKARPPSKSNAPPQNVHIDYSARLVRLVYLSELRPCTIPNVTFCVYSTGYRSGPGILRSHPLKGTSFTILIIPLRLMVRLKPGL